MNIQRAAQVSGLSPDTIRFYERKGVLPRPPRRANGYRDYTAEHVGILALAKGLRDVDLPLAEMRLTLGVAHDGTCGDLRTTLVQTLSGSLQAIDDRLRGLAETKEHLGAILGGLQQMRPNQRRVPGTSPCSCVHIVGGVADEGQAESNSMAFSRGRARARPAAEGAAPSGSPVRGRRN